MESNNKIIKITECKCGAISLHFSDGAMNSLHKKNISMINGLDKKLD